MSTKNIVMDEESLKEVCKETTLEDARPVIQDLMDTANSLKGKCAGLASNQVGSNLRVFVIKYRGKFVWFINPSFEPAGKKVQSKETCLSFFGKESVVERYNIILTSGPKGKTRGLILDGMAAICFQHELDHLNGITI